MQISSHTRCTIYCSVHTHIRVGAGSPPLIVYLIVIYLFTCNSATTIKMLNPNTLGRLGSPWGRNSRTSDVLSSYIGKIRIKRRPQSQFNLSYGMWNDAFRAKSRTRNGNSWVHQYQKIQLVSCCLLVGQSHAPLSPREAAFEILRHVNQGSPRSALLALHVSLCSLIASLDWHLSSYLMCWSRTVVTLSISK